MDNSNISVHLGQTSQYKSTYDPTLLVREPRQNNRTYLGIKDDDLPFVGSDTWNAYECSFLLDSGLPVTGVLKIVYPCSSKYIVESKSIKLYLNSFNMQKSGKTRHTAISSFEHKVSVDLSELLETDVNVKFLMAGECCEMNGPTDEWGLETFVCLEDIVGNIPDVDVYEESPDLLEGEILDETIEQWYRSELLKSNCRVTSQPDWGDVFIYYKGKCKIDEEALLRYIVSFRDECHFHEEICECIYQRLWDTFEPEELSVMCLYARRGGIDINPIRCSSQEVYDEFGGELRDVNTSHVKTAKQ
jgi:7-cyano-7-deazaguanine reductase